MSYYPVISRQPLLCGFASGVLLALAACSASQSEQASAPAAQQTLAAAVTEDAQAQESRAQPLARKAESAKYAATGMLMPSQVAPTPMSDALPGYR
ncbi:MAG: hypothetical protein ACRERX_13240, partial [Pseudomonas sp.]